MGKKLYIKTYGCQMNVYDSARMADVMAKLGYAQSETPEGVDLVILNTCHIREKAEEKLYSDLGRLRKVKGRGKMLIAVGGCVGQAAGEEILKRAPYVNMVFGPQSYHRLPDMVARAERGAKAVELDFEPEPKFDSLPEESSKQGASALLSVQEGCDKFCTFCVVPYTRGAEFSRTPEAIEEEARRLVDKGALEITLLGQNVNAYHGGGETLAKLIRRLAKIEGLKRIRYITSHPLDMSADLIAAHGEVEKLMPFLHLPVQSGSDRILNRMNRKHTAAYYMEIIEKLRKARPDIALSSDFIVGFPGESDIDFAATLRLVDTVGFAQAYSFKYSPRPGTPAATEEQLPEEVKEARLAELQALIARDQMVFNRRSIGQTVPVLFDRKGRRESQLAGRTPHMQAIHIDIAKGIAGKIVPATITEAYQNSVAGIVMQGDSALLSSPRKRGTI